MAPIYGKTFKALYLYGYYFRDNIMNMQLQKDKQIY